MHFMQESAKKLFKKLKREQSCVARLVSGEGRGFSIEEAEGASVASTGVEDRFQAGMLMFRIRLSYNQAKYLSDLFELNLRR